MAAVKGTIKRLVSDKGFGFVAAQDGTEYLLSPVGVHRGALHRTARRTVRHVRSRSGSEGAARRTRHARLTLTTHVPLTTAGPVQGGR